MKSKVILNKNKTENPLEIDIARGTEKTRM